VEEEKEDKEGEAEKEKFEKPAKVTIHNVYIKAKDKKSIDRTAEAKELIKKELNLKLSVRLSPIYQIVTELTIHAGQARTASDIARSTRKLLQPRRLGGRG
jgi:hypothetical protein